MGVTHLQDLKDLKKFKNSYLFICVLKKRSKKYSYALIDTRNSTYIKSHN